MRNLIIYIIITLGLTLSACGEEEAAPETSDVNEATTPSAPSAGLVQPGDSQTALMTLQERLGVADAANGRLQFIQCRSCHTLGREEHHLTGPNLWNVVDAPAGGRADFAYSKALKAAELVWDLETLDAFIKSPADVVDGTRMIFRGVRDNQKRANLIAYIISETK